MDKLYKYILENYRDHKLNIYCLVQRDSLSKIKLKFPEFKFIIYENSHFSYRTFRSQKELRSTLHRFKFDLVIIPSSYENFDNFFDIKLIATSIATKELIFVNCNMKIYKENINLNNLILKQFIDNIFCKFVNCLKQFDIAQKIFHVFYKFGSIVLYYSYNISKPRKNTKKVFLTLFFKAENIHLIKDVGMIPFIMAKNFNYNAKLATYNNGDYSYLNNEVKELNIDFIEKKYTSDYKNCKKYLITNSRNIDILNLYHFTDTTLKLILIYKFINLKGKVFLKLDANEDIKNIKITNWYCYILKKCNLISVESKKLYVYLNNNWPINIQYIQNGYYNFIEKKRVNYKEKENNILFVGRVGSFEKSTDVLLEGFRKAEKFIPEWKLIIVGPIEESFKEYIEEYFKKNPNLRSKIKFLGAIYDRNKLNEIYDKSKIFCLTSRFESFGLVFLEAMNSGCYIITSNILSAKDVTDDEKYGQIFEIGNADMLAKLLVNNCKDEYRLKVVCNEVQEFCYKKFNWINICKKINDILKD